MKTMISAMSMHITTAAMPALWTLVSAPASLTCSWLSKLVVLAKADCVPTALQESDEEAVWERVRNLYASEATYGDMDSNTLPGWIIAWTRCNRAWSMQAWRLGPCAVGDALMHTHQMIMPIVTSRKQRIAAQGT